MNMTSIEESLESLSPEQYKSGLWLRNFILSAHPAISEGKKYGIPFLLFHERPMAYFFIKGKNLEISFLDGKKINELGINNLEERGRKYVGSWKINGMADVLSEKLKDIVHAAIFLQEEWQHKKKGNG